METAIKLHNVRKVFRDHPRPLAAVADIDLTIKSGEFFVLIGPSGSGKSTLLRLMSGLDTNYEGEILWHPALANQTMSFVFQQFALLPWLTVRQNIQFNLLARHLSPAVMEHRTIRELKRFHLEKFAHSLPKELSGGMRQRAGLARALAADPTLIFMDEPFSELDTYTAKQLREQFLDIWQAQHPTVIMVTHLIEEAIELADRIALLSDRPARIKSIITNPLPRPRTRRTEDFYALEDKLLASLAP